MGTVTKLETLEDLIQKHLEIAKSTHAEGSEIKSTFVGYSSSGQFVVPLLFSNDKEKEIVLSMIELLCVAKGITRYIISLEGWELGDIKEYKRLQKAGLRISDSPLKQEVLSCMACSYNDRKMIVYNIDRSSNNLTKVRTQSGIKNLSGAFLDLLPTPKPTPEQRTFAKQALKEGKWD